jgi:hypothetical protein
MHQGILGEGIIEAADRLTSSANPQGRPYMGTAVGIFALKSAKEGLQMWAYEDAVRREVRKP